MTEATEDFPLCPCGNYAAPHPFPGCPVDEDPNEPDDPEAFGLAQLIKSYRMSTVQRAFRYLDSKLTFEIVDVDEPDTLRPRSERCPEPECQAGGECWRCDYEESQAARATPAPDVALRDQIAAALNGGTLVSFIADDGHPAMREATGHELADAVLAVPAIRRLAEAEDGE